MRRIWEEVAVGIDAVDAHNQYEAYKDGKDARRREVNPPPSAGECENRERQRNAQIHPSTTSTKGQLSARDRERSLCDAMADCVTDIIGGPKHGVVFYPAGIGYSIESN